MMLAGHLLVVDFQMSGESRSGESQLVVCP